jgi:lipopolysaccharide export system permease protein
MTLHLYFARKFTVYFTNVFCILFLFCITADLANQLRWFGDLTDFKTVVYLSFLSTPETVYTIMPLIMIFSSIWLFLNLAQSSELVVARASGRSGIAFLTGPIIVSILITSFVLAIFNPIVAITSERYLDQSNDLKNGGTSVISIGSDGLWLRQGDDDGYTVIRATSANAIGSIFFNVSFFTYFPDGTPIRRIEAKTAQLGAGEWRLYTVKEWPLTKRINPEANSKTYRTMIVPTDLTQNQVKDRFEKPSSVPVWSLPSTIEQLKSAGFSARRHEVWLQAEIARPLFLIAMVLLGAAFSMRHARFGGTGSAVLTAVICGFGLFYVRNFAQVLGESGQLPILIAVWTPPVASVLLGLSIILHLEDG